MLLSGNVSSHYKTHAQAQFMKQIDDLFWIFYFFSFYMHVCSFYFIYIWQNLSVFFPIIHRMKIKCGNIRFSSPFRTQMSDSLISYKAICQVKHLLLFGPWIYHSNEIVNIYFFALYSTLTSSWVHIVIVLHVSGACSDWHSKHNNCPLCCRAAGKTNIYYKGLPHLIL